MARHCSVFLFVEMICEYLVDCNGRALDHKTNYTALQSRVHSAYHKLAQLIQLLTRQHNTRRNDFRMFAVEVCVGCTATDE